MIKNKFEDFCHSQNLRDLSMPDSCRQQRVFSWVFGFTRSKDFLNCVFYSIF